VIGDHLDPGAGAAPEAGAGAEAEARSSATAGEGKDGAAGVTTGGDEQPPPPDVTADARASVIPRVRRMTTTLARAPPRLKREAWKALA